VIHHFIGPSHLDSTIARIAGPRIFTIFNRYNTFASYVAFIAGIVFFVLSLRKFTLRYQFHQLGWTLLTLVLIVAQFAAHLHIIYSGICW
jgi:phosphatidate cytidylyltransferase